jgi:hypothetical protein
LKNNIFPESAHIQEIMDFSLWNYRWKVALEQDLSIGAIFRLKNYLYVPLILSTGQNGM